MRVVLFKKRRKKRIPHDFMQFVLEKGHMMVLLLSLLTQLTSSEEIVLLFKAQIKILCCDLMTMCFKNVKKA